MKKSSDGGYTSIEKGVIGFAIGVSVIGFFMSMITLISFSDGQSILMWDNKSSDGYGNLGDFIGGFIGSLWGFTGVLLFFITLQLQRRTLKSQLDEMENTRAVFSDELHSINLQQFESKFFQLLQLHNQSLSSIKVLVEISPKKKEYIESKHFFSFLTEKIFETFQESYSEGKELSSVFEGVYERVYDEYKNTLGQYFRNLTLIIKFVDAAPELKTDDERNFYIQILRAQLSNDEVLMIAYNGFSDEGRWFAGTIDKYKMLRYLDFEIRNKAHTKNKLVSAELLIDRYSHLKQVHKEQRKRALAYE